MSRCRRFVMLLVLTVLGVEALWAWPWSRDMVYQIYLHAQQQVFLPAAGAIPLGWEPPRSREAAARLESPVAAGPETLQQGNELYDTYCAVCHGAEGRGDGPVAGGALLPADLTLPRVQEQPDGVLYETIRNGVGTMPAYYDRLSSRERWMAVLYLKTLGE